MKLGNFGIKQIERCLHCGGVSKQEVRFNTWKKKFERSSPLCARFLNFTNV